MGFEDWGARLLSRSAQHRLRRAGSVPAARDAIVTLDYPTLKVFRGRLRNLMDVGGIG